MAIERYIEVRNLNADSIELRDKIILHLQRHPNRAYLVRGLMMDALGVPEEQIKGNFGEWGLCQLQIFNGRPLATIYSKTRSCLNKLTIEGRVVMQKKDNKVYFHWRN